MRSTRHQVSLQPPGGMFVDERAGGCLWRGVNAWFVGECVAHTGNGDELDSGGVGVGVCECAVEALRWLVYAWAIVIFADDEEHRGLPALYDLTSACDKIEVLRDRGRRWRP